MIRREVSVSMPMLVKVLVVGTAVSLVVWAAFLALLRWRGVSVWWRTMFGPAIVFDSADDDGTPVRLLNVGGTFQSICYTDDELRWELVCEYHRTMADVVARASEDHDLRRALVMGGGGFSFPKWLVTHSRRLRVDAVEIDPKVIDIARERFCLAEAEAEADGRLNVVCADAWAWLCEGCDEGADEPVRYDLIVSDAFGGKKPLGPMQGFEGAQMVRKRLAPGGVFLANVRSPLEGDDARGLLEAKAAFGMAFEHVEVIPERPEEPGRLQNNVLVAYDEGWRPSPSALSHK